MIELTTSITTLIFGLFALGYTISLWLYWRKEKSLVGMCWVIFMVTLFIAAIVSTFTHYISRDYAEFLASYYFFISINLGITSFCIVVGSYISYFGREGIKTIVWIATPFVLIFYIASFLAIGWENGYWIVDIFGIVSLLFSLLWFSLLLVRDRNRSALWMINGIILFFIATAVRASHTELFLPLNHNDIYHLIGVASVYYFYLGMKPQATTELNKN